MSLKLDMDSLRYIAALAETSGVEVKDCVVHDDIILFIVTQGQGGQAIGKGGMHSKKLSTALGKRVRVIENDADPIKFMKNLLGSIPVREVTLMDDPDAQTKSILITADFKSRGAILGKDGKKVQILKELLKRHNNIENIKVN